ncbi:MULTISPECIES: SLBB domain-containing protein [Gammaproteobacteria]|uniref:SLBB domain-containing protein n=1 Tax=Gammaproteobacteria TaxID=1236 RepID=UPI000DCF8B3A|nr:MULTISPECIES: SLBB domain-containing protein [Gammaproteobacteria]RTE86054.1 polysaccharide biosynthesis protein [Aliidiomarina sp. B3213]TCZ91408.1 polysaccharide biosynthesis protein [Lysobacter sp. N42]
MHVVLRKFITWGVALSISLVGLGMLSQNAEAQQITQAQIEQFRQLPRAQQEALARQYGIDLSMLEGQAGSNTEARQDPATVEARELSDTQSDYEGERTGSRTDRERETEAEVKPFGYNVFAGRPTTFAPVNNAPVPGSYRLGVGDTVMVQLYGQESISHSLVVDREGRITIPRLGPLTVAGLSYNELKELVRNQVSTRMIGMQAAVSMGELRSMQIFVLGEAYQPGAYTVSSLTTISQALFASGGVTEIASLRDIRLMRAGEMVTGFDLYDLLIRGDASKDRILQPGDAVFIPARGPMVKISGEVVRPAIYELTGNESLDDVIQLAGGLLPSAYPDAVQLHRADRGQRSLRTLDVSSQSALSLAMQGGDEIRVPRISEVIDNSVSIVGAATRTGSYEWRSGIKISDFVKSPTQDLQADADLNYGLVIREDQQTREMTVLQFDVASALRGDMEHDLRLQPRDQVMFFSRFEKEYRRALAGYGQYASNPEEVRPVEDGEEAEQRHEQQFEQDSEAQPIRTVRESEYTPNSRTRLLRSVLARLSSQESSDASALFVRISGEARFPGNYPLVENGSVADLIAAAGGLKESAYLARAEITRTLIDGGNAMTDYLSFNLLDAITGVERVDIRARDHLSVFRIPEWQDTVQVELTGEVMFPGSYSVRRGETLIDVVERAGGLTQHAYPPGAVFTREEVKEQERQRVAQLARNLRQELASISLTEGSRVGNYEELNSLLSDLQGTEPVGRMVVNLESILAGDRAQDLTLRDGDSLYIPNQLNTVSIIGEVQMPTTYRYEQRYSVSDYLARSGGTKRRADEERMFIIRANGEIEPYHQQRGWFASSGRMQLEPGDTIVVPLDSTYREPTQVWATSTQIIYQLAVAAAAIARL